jgi:hypothetical protein
MTYARLDASSIVVELIESSDPVAGCVRVLDGMNARVGAMYTGWEFVAPRWSAYQFLGRFTTAELDGILAAAKTDATTLRFLTFAQAAQEVISDDPATVAGMAYLVSFGLLGSARADEILANNGE